MIRVLDRTTFRIHGGGIQHPQGGYDGQLSRCQFRDVTFYVREAIARSQFHGGSGVGMALKRGDKVGTDVLELCAPDEVFYGYSESGV